MGPLEGDMEGSAENAMAGSALGIDDGEVDGKNDGCSLALGEGEGAVEGAALIIVMPLGAVGALDGDEDGAGEIVVIWSVMVKATVKLGSTMPSTMGLASRV
jgi:hypothetical protein